jgi:hypothetical protein
MVARIPAIPCLLLLLSGATSWGSNFGETAEEARKVVPSPIVALARHFSGSPGQSRWTNESVHIEASLPKLAERGSLAAIRRQLPLAPPEYHVLSSDGGRTVRQQVIGRYLSADAEAATLSQASVAVTPANYRFRFIASLSDGETLTYIYEITPREKRTGLIRGQLWIDAGTGIAVRQSGQLVRTPSIFVRNVHITRETLLREGAAHETITRVEIDTRLFGRANLTIRERPCLSESCEDPDAGVD